MNVLSLCDGAACGKMSLDKVFPGRKINYYAIENNKFARLLADSNIEGIIRPRHDVYDITARKILLDWPVFDLIIFGSTCKSVSNAGNGTGLDGSSRILFKCMEILALVKYRNPNAKFLIENVKMKKEFKAQFDKIIGFVPALINSALVSAQNRWRYYWTGSVIGQPTDRGVLIADILETPGAVFKYSESNRYEDEKGKRYQSPKDKPNLKRIVERRAIETDKSLTLTTAKGCGSKNKSLNMVVTIPRGFNKGSAKIDKTGTLTGCSWEQNNLIAKIENGEIEYRKLTVRECARLQTWPEWYSFDSISDSQAYKAIGNGWTVEVIIHVLKQMYGV